MRYNKAILITIENRPSVRIVIGRVKIFITGLTKVFKTPRTTATINAEVISSSMTPGSICETTKTAIVVANILIKNFI